MIIFYQYFVFFFMNRNYSWLFPYFWRFNFLKRFFEIDFKSKIRDWLQIFIILINTLLQPEALIGSNVFIIASISVSVTWKKLILPPGLYENDDIQLTLHIGRHIEAKQLLKMFVFFFTKVCIKSTECSCTIEKVFRSWRKICACKQFYLLKL